MAGLGGAADPTDPFIVAQAQALNNDPNQIFAFVRDQVKFEVYAGSLRGARGALWSMAGNALDRASLLVALLEASGFAAQYVRGTLDIARQQELILSMFTIPRDVIGCLAPNATVADPANDPALLQQAGDHWWVVYGAAGAVPTTALDPSFQDAQVGQVFGTATAQLAAVPDALRHRVTFRLAVEQYSQASAAFGVSPFSTTEVLNTTFETADLVGKPVTLGHFVSNSTFSALFLTDTSYTYSPYVRVGIDPANIALDQVVRGQDYEELYTDFPLASQYVTGIFLYMDVADAAGHVRTYEREILDRVGFDVRVSGGAIATPPSAAFPAVSDYDLYTVLAAPSTMSAGFAQSYQGTADTLAAESTTLQSRLAGIDPNAPTSADQAVETEFETNTRDALVTISRVAAASHAVSSDTVLNLWAPKFNVKAYPTEPRLLLSFSKVKFDTDGSVNALELALDLRKDNVSVVAPPAQATQAPFDFQIFRGLMENALETRIGESIAASLADGQILTNTVSAAAVFQVASAAGLSFAAFTPTTSVGVTGLSISAQAKARIQAALASGRSVIVPASMVTLNGVPTIAWYEVDLATGETTGVLEDGGHGELVTLASRYALAVATARTALVLFGKALARPLGFAMGVTIGNLLVGFVKGGLPGGVGDALQYFYGILGALAVSVLPFLKVVPGFWGDFVVGFYIGFFKTVGPTPASDPDPPIPTILEPWFPASPVPGSGGVSVGIALNPRFSVVIQNAEIPLVAQAALTNHQSKADAFTLAPSTSASGFSVQQSVQTITLGASETGSETVCLVPTGGPLPPPGTMETVTLTATSTSDSSVTGSSQFLFTVPSIAGLSLTTDVPSVSITPGTSAGVTLRTAGTGNVTTTATLSVAIDPQLTMAGLPTTVVVAAGETLTQGLVIGAVASAPLDRPMSVTITANFGDASNPQSSAITVPVHVVAAQAISASTAAESASSLGRQDIADTLSRLAGAIDDVLADCTSAAKAELLAYLDALTSEMNAPFLTDYVAKLQSVRSAIASDNCASVGAELDTLSGVLVDLATTLRSPVAFPFDLVLAPNSAVVRPGQATSFKVLIANHSPATNTYTLSLGALPAGVTGGLNVTSVTLPPNGDTSAVSPTNPVITLTEGSSSVAPAEFTVTAAVQGVDGSERTTKGTLTVQQEFLAVTSVQATPGIVKAGDATDVTAHLANVVNEPRTVNVSLAMKDRAGTVVLMPPAQSVQLSVQHLVTIVDFGSISTQGLADGDYTLLVTVTDPTTGQTLPGGTGSGALLVGLPVTATLSVSPSTLPPGNGMVTTSLNVTSQNPGGGGLAFSLLGNVATASPGESLAVNGNIAYTCDDNEISAIDVTDPTQPSVLATAASDSLKNDGNAHCSLKNGKLIAFADATSSLVGNNPVFLYFDLGTPTQPSFVKATTIPKRFFGEPVYIGNTAFVPTNAVFFFPGDGIIDQRGDVVAVDVSDFDNPHVLGSLEQGVQSFDATYGGHNSVFGAAVVDAQTLLVGTSSATGGGGSLNSGIGQLLVVDVSNPAAMTTLKTVDVPGTVHLLKPIVQGSLAIALGSAGYHVPCCTSDDGPLVVATFDISDLSNPTLLGTVTTTLNPASGGGLQAIGNNLFLFAGLQDSDNKLVLLQVDTTDPAHPTVQTFPIATQVNRMLAVGTVLYTVGPNGLTAYSIPGVGGTQYSATVQIDKNGTVAYDPTSFSVPPTSIMPGSGFDTVSWLNPGDTTITWKSNVTGILPGQAIPVAEGGNVAFTTALGSGTIALSQVSVTSEHILGLTPAAQTAAPGQLASYTVTVKNPTPNPVTYTLGVEGVTPSWVTLAGSVTVPASGQIDVPLGLRSELGAAAADYGFVVTASTTGGAQDSVHGTLTVQGSADIGQPASTTALGVSVSLVPTQATAGQGTTVTYGVQVTNAGNTIDTYTLSASLPSGVSGVFDQTSVQVPPGLSNFRQIELQLTPAPGTSAGSPTFTVTATSTASSSVHGVAIGTLTIVSSGVSVGLDPPSAGPGSTFQMTVKNTGQAQDTFDLSLGGPAAVVATLGSAAVTLAPNASQNVPITVGAVNFADPGSLGLTAVATSRANPAVRASATAAITIGTTQSVAAEFSPSAATLASPGSASFLLLVHNTGNIEDEYSGVITQTTGPVSASLTDLTGQAAQSVPAFRLPGLSTGAIPLTATLTAPGQGTVTVRVTSLTDGAITSSSVAVIRIAGMTPQVATQSSPNATNVALGTPASDSAIVSAAAGGPIPTGTVTFFLCPPSQVTAAGCPASGGAQVGAVKTLNGNGGATSDPAGGGTLAGRYCWRAEYSGDGNYASSSHTDASLECFTVALASPGLTTRPDPPSAGPGQAALGDAATLSGAFNPTGSITFSLFAPDDTTCSDPIFTNTVPVSGNGTYHTLASFPASAVTQVGGYNWTARYGGDQNNNPVDTPCGAAAVRISPAAIPTLSGWAMLLLAFLVLGIGSVLIVRRRRPGVARLP